MESERAGSCVNPNSNRAVTELFSAERSLRFADGPRSSVKTLAEGPLGWNRNSTWRWSPSRCAD
jgi:hypothetical protein